MHQPTARPPGTGLEYVRPLPLIFLLLLVAVGCGDAVEPEQAPPEVTVVTGAPTFSDAPPLSLASLETDVTVMAGLEGQVLAGTDAGLYRLESGGLTRLEAQDSTGATVSTGAIRAIVRREEGLLIAADEGIFYTEGDLVIRSPLTDVLADLDVLDLSSTGQGDAETVWVVALEGLYRVTSAALEMLEIPELTALPTAVGALDQVILLAVDDALIELDPVTLVPVTLPDVGPVAKIRVVGTEAWIATGSGLLRRDATGDYTRYTLSDAEAGEPVYDVAVDYAGRAIATSGPGVVRLDAGTLEGLYSAALLGNAPAIALDTTGNVWLGGSALTGLLIGEPIGFEATIAPIFATNCNGCHLHGTAAPAHDFTDYTEVMAMVQEILQRVLSGQMPPGAPLEDYEYDALELWSETGMNP